MSEIAKIPTSDKNQKQAPMTVRVIGKITRTRRHEQFTYTTVITPAPDAYSKPSVVEIRSKQRFGERDEEIDVMATLGGYEGRSYRITDRETGEVKMLVPVNTYLDLIE